MDIYVSIYVFIFIVDKLAEAICLCFEIGNRLFWDSLVNSHHEPFSLVVVYSSIYFYTFFCNTTKHSSGLNKQRFVGIAR